MTRINCVPPSELTVQHLVAEYRELPRIFALVRAAIARGERPDDTRNPTEYRLGSGHVRFFTAKVESDWTKPSRLAFTRLMRSRAGRSRTARTVAGPMMPSTPTPATCCNALVDRAGPLFTP